jgi:hypothetical protein
MMRIHLKHASLTDPIAVLLPDDTHIDTFRQTCATKTGIDGAFDLILDNACHTKITSLDTLRDEDVVILRSTRDDHEGNHPKRMRLTPPDVIEVDATNTEKTKATNVEQAHPFGFHRKFPLLPRAPQKKGPADGSDVRRHIMKHFPDVKVVKVRCMWQKSPRYWAITIASKRQTAEEKNVEKHDIYEFVTKQYGRHDARVTVIPHVTR